MSRRANRPRQPLRIIAREGGTPDAPPPHKADKAGVPLQARIPAFDRSPGLRTGGQA
ncbi:hypothetical protein RR42_s2407 [Cupriavidus basilensis]|uniref:Uncharacterized protein n=1 Tax=Cupriavidus basilensis TaxID=68895 RepID=A0A0C4YPL8_9BURK|nr:hypothetical protein RR42_s2407 [Cupriavidus basilensis]